MRHLLLPLLFALATTGCADLAARRMADNLSSAILNQDDPRTVRDGAPAFLLLVDGLLEGSPTSPKLLRAGSGLYGAYAGAFVDDPERRRRLSATALSYARRALCLDHRELCRAETFPQFATAIEQIETADVAALYTYGAALAGWIQARQTDWKALAELPKVEAVMRRVIALDERHDHGRAHVYLGAIDSRLPATLGGRPASGKAHFKRALELSEGRDLIAALEYARTYARTVFDKALHDRLLRRVIESDPHAPELTLSNVIAQRRAEALLSESNEFFGE